MNAAGFFPNRTMPAAFFLLIFCLVLSWCPSDAAESVTKQVPRFALPSAPDGKTVSLDEHRGKVILINFWATWCGPCRMEIPSLVKLQEKYAGKGFTVIGISLDEGRANAVGRFMEKNSINYPVLMGDNKISNDFGGVLGVPYSFLVNRVGNIVSIYPGLIEGEQIEADVKKLL